MVLEAMEKKFSFMVDKSGLEGPYIPPTKVSAQAIIDSYNPYVDSELLKSNPICFDIFRKDYNYREEVSFEA